MGVIHPYLRYVYYMYIIHVSRMKKGKLMDSGELTEGLNDLPRKDMDSLAKQIPGSIFRLMALLSEGPKSGYDISMEVSSEELSNWKDSFGNIYPNLRKMVEMGLAEKQRDDFKGRKRVYYSLTEEGKKLIDWWLKEPAQRYPLKNELIFKLRFASRLGVNVILDHLRGYLSFCEQNHPMFDKWFSDVAQSEETGLEFEVIRLTSDFWYRYTKTLLEWSGDTVKRLEKYQRDNAPKGGGPCSDSQVRCYFSPCA